MKNKLPFIKNRKIKIIAGKWKGRQIPIKYQSLIRPTTNRIRETLFNWINPVISNATCLDCFTGSGALGLESLSRGARKVTFIDQNHDCIKTLMQTIQDFQENKSEVIHDNCCHWLKHTKNTYNIVFIDPPFYNNFIIYKVILLLENFNHLKKQSWIYIETSKHQKFFDIYNPPIHWNLYRKKITQNIICHLYFRKL